MSRYMTPPFGDFYGPGRGRGFGNSYALPMTPRGISRMQPMGYGMDQGFGGYGNYDMNRGYGGYGIGRGGFDMSRIYEGLPAPGYIPGYGEVGGETDYGFYPQDTGGGGGEETEEQRRARQIRENEEEGRRTYGGGSEPADKGISSGRGREVGSFGDWAGRMAEMARDVMQGAYQGDSSYGPGPGTGPSPDAKEGDPGGYSGGREGDMATGGRVRRFEAGGGADAGGAGDVRGQGGDQASYPDLMSMLNDPNFRGDWGKVLDMATVGPTRGFLEVSGIGRGGDYGTPSVEVDTSTGGMAERGASRDARGGAIHYASGGGGGGGREGDPRTETTEEASDAVYRWLKSFGLRPSKENIEIAEMAVYGTPPAKSNAAPDLGGDADRQEERGIGRDNRIETRELPPLPRMTTPAPTAALLRTLGMEGRSPDRRMEELIEEERSSLYPSYAGIAEFPGARGIGRPMSGVDYGSMSNADLIKLIRFPQDPGIRLEAEAELKRRKLERRAPMRASGGGIGYAVGGPGDGRADKIPAMLSDGEHIIPADVVSGLGRGSSKAGHEKLNQMILKERAKYRKTLGKLPPPKD